MNDRLHASLDGELPREALSPAELARLAVLESAIDEVTTRLRARPAPDLASRIMQQLTELQPGPTLRDRGATLWQRTAAWLWQPRALQLRFRPAYALLGAAALALLLVQVPFSTSPEALPVMIAEIDAASAPVLYVQFRLEAPEADHVALAGSFTDWEPRYELQETGAGIWTVLVPLTPGVHDYTFVVDGEEWIPDPHAPRVRDSFSGFNSRLFLPAPAGSV